MSTQNSFDGKNLHTLIAGISGSGKSTLVRTMLQSIKAAGGAQLILIDPKRTELTEQKYWPNCLQYAAKPDEIADALDIAAMMLEDRLDEMARKEIRVYDGDHVFIVVDEMAFLMQSDRKKEYARMLNQITLLGRAARIHLILCTQVATQDVIPACIRDNMTNIVCLRQRDAGKYRYLLGCYPGRLPLVGYAYVFTPSMERPEKMKTERVWDAITNW